MNGQKCSLVTLYCCSSEKAEVCGMTVVTPDGLPIFRSGDMNINDALCLTNYH